MKAEATKSSLKAYRKYYHAKTFQEVQGWHEKSKSSNGLSTAVKVLKPFKVNSLREFHKSLKYPHGVPEKPWLPLLNQISTDRRILQSLKNYTCQEGLSEFPLLSGRGSHKMNYHHNPKKISSLKGEKIENNYPGFDFRYTLSQADGTKNKESDTIESNLDCNHLKRGVSLDSASYEKLFFDYNSPIFNYLEKYNKDNGLSPIIEENKEEGGMSTQRDLESDVLKNRNFSGYYGIHSKNYRTNLKPENKIVFQRPSKASVKQNSEGCLETRDESHSGKLQKGLSQENLELDESIQNVGASKNVSISKSPNLLILSPQVKDGELPNGKICGINKSGQISSEVLNFNQEHSFTGSPKIPITEKSSNNHSDNNIIYNHKSSKKSKEISTKTLAGMINLIQESPSSGPPLLSMPLKTSNENPTMNISYNSKNLKSPNEPSRKTLASTEEEEKNQKSCKILTSLIMPEKNKIKNSGKKLTKINLKLARSNSEFISQSLLKKSKLARQHKQLKPLKKTPNTNKLILYNDQKQNFRLDSLLIEAACDCIENEINLNTFPTQPNIDKSSLPTNSANQLPLEKPDTQKKIRSPTISYSESKYSTDLKEPTIQQSPKKLVTQVAFKAKSTLLKFINNYSILVKTQLEVWLAEIAESHSATSSPSNEIEVIDIGRTLNKRKSLPKMPFSSNAPKDKASRYQIIQSTKTSRAQIRKQSLIPTRSQLDRRMTYNPKLFSDPKTEKVPKSNNDLNLSAFSNENINSSSSSLENYLNTPTNDPSHKEKLLPAKYSWNPLIFSSFSSHQVINPLTKSLSDSLEHIDDPLKAFAENERNLKLELMEMNWCNRHYIKSYLFSSPVNYSRLNKEEPIMHNGTNTAEYKDGVDVANLESWTLKNRFLARNLWWNTKKRLSEVESEFKLGNIEADELDPEELDRITSLRLRKHLKKLSYSRKNTQPFIVKRIKRTFTNLKLHD